MKEFLDIFRKGVKPNKFNIQKKSLTIRDTMNIMRKLNEADNDKENLGKNLKTNIDQKEEETKMKNYFNNLNVDIDFSNLDVFEKGIFWGGTIDGQIQFVYRVTPDENTSGFDLNYTDDFDPNNEDNKAILDKIENYYDVFYKYWRDNIIQD